MCVLLCLVAEWLRRWICDWQIMTLTPRKSTNWASCSHLCTPVT